MTEDTKVSTNRRFTFGFINAMVNSSGVPNLATPNPVVALGTTFGASGASLDFTFVTAYRTYSAQATGRVVTQ